MNDTRKDQLEAARQSALSQDPSLAKSLADYSAKKRDYDTQRQNELVGKGLQSAPAATFVHRLV